MTGPWQPQWSAEIEQAWAKSAKDADPKESIRGGLQQTRPLEPAEAVEIRQRLPSPRARREIQVAPAGATEFAGSEFQLVTEVGSGGMGKVYRAQQTALDREVALKQLKQTTAMPDAVAHFESEACITAVLEHPNIVPVYDMGADQDGAVFYSMKLIEGVPWDTLLYARTLNSIDAPPGGKYDLRAHIEILLEVANALAFAHSRGIIHRDVKPRNIMVGEYGEVLLVDWGLACSLQPVAHPARIFDLSQVLITCGTPSYMPPEISTGTRDWVGAWTDVYMLGAVLFEVLYGLPPHEQTTALDSIKVSSRNEWEFPENIPTAMQPFHEVLKPVICKALASHPDQRYPDGAAFADGIKEALQHLDAAALATEAITSFRAVESQRAQRSGRAAPPDPNVSYRALSKAVAVLEQALSSWPENANARHYLVQARLLHAHIALSNDDLSVARQELQALEHLPDLVTPTPEQSERADALRKRLDKLNRIRERYDRRVLSLQIAALVLALAVLASAGIGALLIRNARDQARRERNQLSQLLIATASDGIEAQLDGLLQPVRASIQTTGDWVKSGRLDGDNPEQLTAFFLPQIARFPVISSILRADEAGHEYMLLRMDQGWQVRVTQPGTSTVFQRISDDGRVERTWTEQLDYNPHTRPWYRGARALGNTEDVYWTEPYTFYTTKQPGLTASTLVTSPKGREFVIGVDTTLTDLSAFTMSMPDTEHGKVFVVSDESKVIGLPRDPRFESEQAKLNAVLTAIEDLDEPISAAAWQHWQRDGKPDTPFRFELDGQAWWSGFRRFGLGGERPLWIGVVLPEADFAT